MSYCDKLEHSLFTIINANIVIIIAAVAITPTISRATKRPPTKLQTSSPVYIVLSLRSRETLSQDSSFGTHASMHHSPSLTWTLPLTINNCPCNCPYLLLCSSSPLVWTPLILILSLIYFSLSLLLCVLIHRRTYTRPRPHDHDLVNFRVHPLLVTRSLLKLACDVPHNAYPMCSIFFTQKIRQGHVSVAGENAGLSRLPCAAACRLFLRIRGRCRSNLI